MFERTKVRGRRAFKDGKEVTDEVAFAILFQNEPTDIQIKDGPRS